MLRIRQHISVTCLAIMGIFLCSIVCSAASVLGGMDSSQELRIVNNDAPVTMIAAFVAEKTESESDSKHHCPILIHHVLLNFRSGLNFPSYARPSHLLKVNSVASAVPRYLVDRTIRI